jgi:hypothetical protein
VRLRIELLNYPVAGISKRTKIVSLYITQVESRKYSARTYLNKYLFTALYGRPEQIQGTATSWVYLSQFTVISQMVIWDKSLMHS